ncbi:putative small nuclear ribonucleoprotein E [Hypsibius exemplaris]|uniref:Small nuclear ribonucleoprotein E n=1 Tax=Hypsibius exemplaris TaxID=2072580 RepID=A0A1W0X4L8_HYPEX|nr:putative small nuclear ribonucleoprotein E [Hypsibius exemplaris]
MLHFVSEHFFAALAFRFASSLTEPRNNREGGLSILQEGRFILWKTIDIEILQVSFLRCLDEILHRKSLNAASQHPHPSIRILDIGWRLNNSPIIEFIICRQTHRKSLPSSAATFSRQIRSSTMASKAFKVQKVMVQPINLIFRFLQQKDRVAIWLYENTKMRIEGIIIGFDEYMNVVLDQAEEHYVKTKTKRAIGKILLKGDNITLIHSLSKAANMEEKYG